MIWARKWLCNSANYSRNIWVYVVNVPWDHLYCGTLSTGILLSCWVSNLQPKKKILRLECECKTWCQRISNDVTAQIGDCVIYHPSNLRVDDVTNTFVWWWIYLIRICIHWTHTGQEAARLMFERVCRWIDEVLHTHNPLTIYLENLSQLKPVNTFYMHTQLEAKPLLAGDLQYI